MPRPRALLGPVLAGLMLGQSGALRAAEPAPALPAGSGSAPAAKPKAPAAPSAAAKPEASAKPASAAPSAPAGSLPASPLPSAAQAADPKRGAVTRRVDPPAPVAPAKSDTKPQPEKVAAETKKEPAPLAHQKGKPPRKPLPTLPPGTARRLPDADARHQVAGGATPEEIRAGKDDPELRTLREAERVLFPRALPGVEPGWSWDLPRPNKAGGPEVVSSGLPPAAPLAPPSPPSTTDLDWVKRLVLPNLPVRWDERVIKYLKFYRDSPSGRAVARVWVKKSGKYVAALKSELGKGGLPTDLVWLSLIESGHNPTIISPAGAVGLWQFMPDAGRTYGLVIDRWVDERLDPERATEAAARYLGDLYRRFGSWELAMAAYNMGYAGLTRTIRKFSSNDFWELARYEAGLPWETTLYVPKIVATAVVMNNPAAFGLADVAPDNAQSFDTVLVGPGTPLDAVARAAGVPVETIEQLNPQYLAGRTPPAPRGKQGPSFRVRVPSGKGAGASRLLAVDRPELDGVVPYVVRQGDTVETIAAAAGTSEGKVRGLNRVGSQEVLAPGTVLLVPEPDRPPAEVASAREEVVVISRRLAATPGNERVFYRVVAGDTLGSIASSFSASRADVLAWNALDESARLVPGMSLQLFVRPGERPSARCLREHEARVLVAGTAEFFDYFEGLNGKKRIVVAVREGDTLSSIGRRYGMTVGWMERVNRRSRSDRLEPGETVIVYTDRPGVQPARSELTVATLAQPAPPLPDSLPQAGEVAAEGDAPEAARPESMGERKNAVQ